MGYYIDLSKMSLNEFKENLKSRNLLPSQQILKKDVDKNFNVIKKQNIENLHQLQQALKTKNKVKEFSDLTGLTLDYLTILRREINSYHPQPRKIKDFPGLSPSTKEKLEKKDIKTTPQLYQKVALKTDWDELKKELGFNEEEALVLAKICDVSRLRYVNPAFATLLLNSDFDTVEKIKNATPDELYQNLVKVNENKKYYKGRINPKDMEFLVNETLNVLLDVEY